MKNNGLMMQYFEWYMDADHSLWRKVKEEADKLKTLGVTAMWLPPAYKGAAGDKDVGYGVYDLYDLGEFKQKGSIPTKYGTKKEYIEMISEVQKKGIDIYADIVLNHKIGADETERIQAEEFNACSRNQMVGDAKTILGWTKYTFPGRKGKYSDFTWNWTHFDGIDWDQQTTRNAIFRFVGKTWEQAVDAENGNYDYLMGADIDFDNQEVKDELYKWGQWYLKMTGVHGFRIDAVKHIGHYFYRDWIPAMREACGRDLFCVGEYWHWDVNKLDRYLANVNYEMDLFDVPLHMHFHDASKAHGNYNMATILNDTLVARHPMCAVTFVDNHDTQPGQALQSWVEDWFKPHAYAITMLRQDGYPCVFYGDYNGIPHDNIAPKKQMLNKMMKLRKRLAYGPQHDYFDDYNVVGWTREGDDQHKNSGMAVIMSDSTGGSKRMYVGKKFAGQFFKDALGNAKYNVKIDDDGCGEFYVNRETVSIWISEAVRL
ncbi:MAG: alpha-amylase [Lachnospiraceae bacterium]|nr:alpha-amylase [Lachnospiraceae bacterium]